MGNLVPASGGAEPKPVSNTEATSATTKIPEGGTKRVILQLRYKELHSINGFTLKQIEVILRDANDKKDIKSQMELLSFSAEALLEFKKDFQILDTIYHLVKEALKIHPPDEDFITILEDAKDKLVNVDALAKNYMIPEGNY
jgi:hypothetical protein